MDIKITIEDSGHSSVPDGTYYLDPALLEDYGTDTYVQHRMDRGRTLSRTKSLIIRGEIARFTPSRVGMLERKLKDAIELLWRTQVDAEAEPEKQATPPGSFWIEEIEDECGIKDIDRHGWRDE